MTYSGTIAGAMEGTILGVPSFALSQALSACAARQQPFWDTRDHAWPGRDPQGAGAGHAAGRAVNVNFPDCAPERRKGIAVTTQGKRDQELLHIDRAP